MSERSYFVSIPNLVLDMDLSEHALRLYLRIKREAWDYKGGKCKQPIGVLARMARMGKSSAIAARNELAEPRPELGGRALIEVHEESRVGSVSTHSITITDIWPENMARYAGRAAAAEPVPSETGRSQSEPARRSHPGPAGPVEDREPVPSGTGSRSHPGPLLKEEERKNKNQEQEPEEEDAGASARRPARKVTQPTDHQLMFQAICDAAGFEPALLDGTTAANVGKLARELRGKPHNATPDEVSACGEAWYSERWRGRARADVRPPNIAQLRTWFGQWRKAHATTASTAGGTRDWGWGT